MTLQGIKEVQKTLDQAQSNHTIQVEEAKAVRFHPHLSFGKYHRNEQERERERERWRGKAST
jgi:hypothetical protein